MSQEVTESSGGSAGTSPGIAAVLSLLIPGVGHIVAGDTTRGLYWLGAWVVILLLGLVTLKLLVGALVLMLNLFVHVGAAIDANKRTKRINAGELNP